MNNVLLYFAIQIIIMSLIVNLGVYIVHLICFVYLRWRLFLLALCNFLFTYNQIKFYPKWSFDDFVIVSCVVWVSTCLVMLIVHAIVQQLLKETEQAARESSLGALGIGNDTHD